LIHKEPETASKKALRTISGNWSQEAIDQRRIIA